MFVETYVSVGIIEEYLEILKKLKYSLVLVEGLNKHKTTNEVKLIPRFTSDTLDELRAKPRYFVRSLIIRSSEDLKGYPRIRKVANLVMLTKEFLLTTGVSSLQKLVNLELPIEVCVKDVIEVLQRRGSKGLWYLMKLVCEGRLDLIISSCAYNLYELVHPFTKLSILNALGIPEVIAHKSLTLIPIRVVRSIGYTL